MGDAFKILKDLIVPKTQNPITFAFKKNGAAVVAGVLRMLAAVGFNDQSTLLANEIGNEWTYGLLPAKLCLAKLP